MKRVLFLISILIALSIQTSVFQGAEYESQSAEDKINQLFTELRKNTSEQSFYNRQIFDEFHTEEMAPSFDYEHSDQLPPGRHKVIHTVGLIGKVKWIPIQGQPYSGVFQGSDNALLRFNLAFFPTPERLVPALSIKVLRDKVHSANFVTAVSLAGQKSQNFFRYSQTNHPHPPPQGIFGNTFFKFTPYINIIGLRDCAVYDSQGNETTTPKYPFQLIFEPNENLTLSYQDNETWFDQVKKVNVGDIPYKIYALEFPEGPLEYIGYLQATTDFEFSYFGDKVYFVRHNRIDYDLQDHPEWKKYLIPYVPNNKTANSTEDLEFQGCPFLS